MREEIDSMKRYMKADKILGMTGLGESMRQVKEYLKKNPGMEREIMEAMESMKKNSRAQQKITEEVQKIMGELGGEERE
jgi:uncharacterized protein YneF (UPF0154 family)